MPLRRSLLILPADFSPQYKVLAPLFTNHIVPSKSFGPVLPISAIKEPLTSSCRSSKTLQQPRVTAIAQNRFLEAAAGVSSLGESATCLACSCCYALGALISNLELAKGFEPPTL